MKNPFSTIKIEPLLQAAEEQERVRHAEKEAKKRGVLRGGTSGNVDANGVVYGACHRVALLRYLGIDAPAGDDMAFYSNAGHQNEERWAALLTGTGTKFLVENEIPIIWEVTRDDGTKVPVTGRPDMVLVKWHLPNYQPFEQVLKDLAKKIDATEDPAESLTLIRQSVACRERFISLGILELTVGIELKKVCSSYRAVEVFLAVKPDTKHLTQAEHYSLKLGKLPWMVAYSSDNSYDTPGYAYKKFHTNERKIKPGRQIFYAGWQGDTFCIVHPESGQVIPTVITGAGTDAFYEMIPRMETEKNLGSRPTDKLTYGEGKGFDSCKYCAFSDACDQYDADRKYDEWLDRALVISQEGKE